MRALPTRVQDLIRSGEYAVHARVRIEDPDGSIVVVGYGDADQDAWLVSVEYGEDLDQPVSDAVVRLRRSVEDLSLAPLMEDSALNRDGSGVYAPRVDVARRIVIETQVTAPWEEPIDNAWQNVFEGVIDRMEWSSPEVTLYCRDLGALLVDQWVEQETTYGDPENGEPLEDVAQAILDDWAPGVTLYAPDSPGFQVTQYRVGEQSVMDALETLAQKIGWAIRYRYDSGSGTWRLTLYEPDRGSMTPQWTFGPDDYLDVTELEIDRDLIRNVVEVEYLDSVSGERETVVAEDLVSIARYGRRWMKIIEADDSPIDTEAEAQAMADAAVADTAWPEAEQQIETLYFPASEIGDLYRFASNGVHYDRNHDWAVASVRHFLALDRQRTTIRTRGKPAGMYRQWFRVSSLPPGVVLYAECQARIVSSTATTVTVEVLSVPPYGTVELVSVVGATLVSGPAIGTPSPSGTQWVFERPAFQAGEGQAVFRASAFGHQSDDDHIIIPERGRDTVGLIMRASVQQVTPTQITVRVAVADPQPGAGDVTIIYVATGGTGLAVTPGSPQTIPAASVTSDLATTGYIDFTITRPEAGSGAGRVTFTGTRGDRVADVDAVDVPELPPDVVGAADVLVIMPRWVYSGADAHLELAITYGSLWRSLRVEYQYSSVPGGPPDTTANYIFDLQAGGGNTTHLVEDADGIVRFWSPQDPPPTITVTPYEGPGGTGAAGTSQFIRPEDLAQSGAVGGRVGTTDDPGTVYQADRILFQHPESLGFQITTVGGVPVVRLDGIASVQQGGTGLSSSPGKGDLLVGDVSDGEGGYVLLSRGPSGSVLQVAGDVVGWGPVPSHTHTFNDMTGQAKPSQLGIGVDGAIVKKAKDSDSFISVTGQPGWVLTWDDLAGWEASPPPVPPNPLPVPTENNRFLQSAGGGWQVSSWGLPPGEPPEVRRFLAHDGDVEGEAYWGLPTWGEVQNKPSVAITTQDHTISGLWTFRRGANSPSLIVARDGFPSWGIVPSSSGGVQRFVINNRSTGETWSFYVTGRIEGPGDGNVGIGGDAVSTYKLSVAGSVRATAGFFDTSDVALKRDIIPLSRVADLRALLLALDPVRFRWRATGEPDIGLVAQQTPEPFLGPDGLTIAYHRITATLVAGWQDHERRLRALELALKEVRRGLA